jgi:hypothetical protein
MNSCHRKIRAGEIYHSLSAIRARISNIKPGEEDKSIKTIRPDMACLEHQIAVLRLLQAEDRLIQYFWRALFALIGAALGAIVFLISK